MSTKKIVSSDWCFTRRYFQLAYEIKGQRINAEMVKSQILGCSKNPPGQVLVNFIIIINFLIKWGSKLPNFNYPTRDPPNQVLNLHLPKASSTLVKFLVNVCSLRRVLVRQVNKISVLH